MLPFLYTVLPTFPLPSRGVSFINQNLIFNSLQIKSINLLNLTSDVTDKPSKHSSTFSSSLILKVSITESEKLSKAMPVNAKFQPLGVPE